MTDEQIEKSVVHLVNQYSIVIQLYYCVRFEFAPSRGQIHANLLAISPKSMMQQQYFENKKVPKKQANDLANWEKKMFGLTAYLQKKITNFLVQPCSVRYTDIQDYEKDINNLLNAVQKHICNSYCMSDMAKNPVQQSNNNVTNKIKMTITARRKKSKNKNAEWDMVKR